MEERKNPLVRQLQITAEGLLDRVARTPAASVAGVAPSEGSAVRLGYKLSHRCFLRSFHRSPPKFSDRIRPPLVLAGPSLALCLGDTIDEVFDLLRVLIFASSCSTGPRREKSACPCCTSGSTRGATVMLGTTPCASRSGSGRTH